MELIERTGQNALGQGGSASLRSANKMSITISSNKSHMLGKTMMVPVCGRRFSFIISSHRHMGLASVLRMWIPENKPGCSPFCGVDRSIDTEKLAGIRCVGSMFNVIGGILDLSIMIMSDGGNPNAVYTRNAYLPPVIFGPGGNITVYNDPDIPVDTHYLLQEDTWVRVRDATMERSYCVNPGYNGVLLSTMQGDKKRKLQSASRSSSAVQRNAEQHTQTGAQNGRHTDDIRYQENCQQDRERKL